MRAVNLIPADQRPGAGQAGGSSGGVAYVIVGLVIVLAALVGLYASARHTVQTKEAEANRLSAEAHEAESAANALAPYTRFVTLRDERVSDVKELAGTRFDWAHAMHELGRVLPRSASLSSVTGTIGATTTEAEAAAVSPSTGEAGASGGAAVSSATPAGSVPTLAIAGCATSQANVALTMDRLRLMNGVSEVSLQSATSSESSGSSGSGSCGSGASFAMTVQFEALPSPDTSASPTTSVTSSASEGSSSGASR